MTMLVNDLLLQASAIPVTDYISNLSTVDILAQSSGGGGGNVNLDVNTSDPGISFTMGDGFSDIIRYIGIFGTMVWVVYVLWKLSIPGNQGGIMQRIGGLSSVLGGILAITAALVPDVLANLLSLIIKIGATIIQVITGVIDGG